MIIIVGIISGGYAMKKTNSFEGKIVSEIVFINNAVRKRVPDGRGGTKVILVPGKMLEFSWDIRGKRMYLFRQRYTSAVHNLFGKGMRDYEIRRYRKWDYNPRVDKTIDKIPVYMADAMRCIA